jgi:hypothetical protein
MHEGDDFAMLGVARGYPVKEMGVVEISRRRVRDGGSVAARTRQAVQGVLQHGGD